jgi:hypothetical protein
MKKLLKVALIFQNRQDLQHLGLETNVSTSTPGQGEIKKINKIRVHKTMNLRNIKGNALSNLRPIH